MGEFCATVFCDLCTSTEARALSFSVLELRESFRRFRDSPDFRFGTNLGEDRRTRGPGVRTVTRQCVESANEFGDAWRTVRVTVFWRRWARWVKCEQTVHYSSSGIIQGFQRFSWRSPTYVFARFSKLFKIENYIPHSRKSIYKHEDDVLHFLKQLYGSLKSS